MFDIFVQAMLALTGVCSVFLSQSRPPWARWACVFGMAGEPFWFYTASHHSQWGIMVLACWYTFCWGKGVYTFWWIPYRARRAIQLNINAWPMYLRPGNSSFQPQRCWVADCTLRGSHTGPCRMNQP